MCRFLCVYAFTPVKTNDYFTFTGSTASLQIDTTDELTVA